MDEPREPHPSERLNFITALNVTSDDATLNDTTPERKDEVETMPRMRNDSAVTASDSLNSDDLDLDNLLAMTAYDLPKVNTSALAAIQSEHGMTFGQGLKLYPKAIFWSAMISLAIIMDGFDTALVSSFFAFPSFRAAYGYPIGDGSFEISTGWQIALSNGSIVGAILGLLANGPFTEKFGYRYAMIGTVLILACFIFLTFFAYTIGTLFAGQILCGLCWGVFSTLTATYAAEVVPLNLRGYLTANVNLCYILGQITATAVLRGFLNLDTEWSYRIPFGIQWVWCAVVLATAILAPESPWFLVRKGRLEQAKGSLVRLTRKDMGFSAEDTVEMMKHTDLVEKKLNDAHGKGDHLSYLECFRGTNLRRTEIACMVFVSQVLSGLPLSTFAAYFFDRIGLSSANAFNMTVGMYGLAIIAAFLALGLLKYFGRRSLYLLGLGLMFILLLAIGIIGSLPESKGTLWTMASLVIVLVFIFDATVGPLTYCLVAEIPSTRLRVNTVILARIAYNVVTLITNILTNYMLNPTSWNWRGKTCFLFAGTNFLCFIYCYFRLPESKGLTYHELDILFERKVNARKFKKVRKKLEETGYFGFYEHQRGREAAWAI